MEIGAEYVMKAGTIEMLSSHATNLDYHLTVIVNSNPFYDNIQSYNIMRLTNFKDYKD